MPRPITAIIDISALRHNLAVARHHAAKRFLWAVIKANAYGHGIERALRGFAEADGVALLDLDEAQRARAAGWRRPILLLEGFFDLVDLEVVEALGLTPVLHHEDQVRMLEQRRGTAPVDVYVKFNTGMNRLGFEPGAAARILERISRLPQVQIAALMMHFANADRRDPTVPPAGVDEQLRRFALATAGWRGKRCLANSAALLLHPHVGGDAVRPGIALYGASTEVGTPATHFGLRAAMHLRARILSVQSVAVGDALGYGGRWLATRPSRIGVVACGYADGYPRVAPDGTPVWAVDRHVPLVGRVSMDMITVDLSDAPNVDVGTEVELWGANVPVDVVAEASGTVGYELLCALAQRVPVIEGE